MYIKIWGDSTLAISEGFPLLDIKFVRNAIC